MIVSHLSTRKYVGWMMVAAVAVVFAGCPQESTETVDADSTAGKVEDAEKDAADKGTAPEADPEVEPEQPTDDGGNTLDGEEDRSVTVGMSAPGVFSADLDIPFQQDSFGEAVPGFGGFDPPAEPDTEPEPAKDPESDGDTEPDTDTVPAPAVEPDPEPTPDPTTEKLPDMGPPLVDNPENLKKLDPEKPLWIDVKAGRVVIVGRVCQTAAALEMFACLWQTKEHEAIVTVDVEAFKVHAGLLAIGAKAGHPVRFQPTYTPAEGSEIEISLTYKDEEGKRKTVRAQDWIQDTQTEKAMTHNWVFGGSGFWEGPDGKKHYMAEGGDFICVSNFSTATLDLPVESSQADSARLYQAFTERIPPIGTPVTMVLTVKKKEG